MPVHTGTTASDGPRSLIRLDHAMKIPGLLLAAVAVTLAAPTVSYAQGSSARPGMPTTTASLTSERNHDDDVCGVSTLRGTYVFAASGFNIVAGVMVPKAIVEVVEFHGDGDLSVTAATVTVNGTISRTLNGSGTYTVKNDCSGTILFTGGPAFDIFVAKDAETIWMIQTGPIPSVFQGTATRTSRAPDQR